MFSAATLIMVMVLAAKFLGFIKQRVLFHYFPPEVTDVYLAAFEIPDVIFEVFIYGVLSASFVPVFTSYLAKKKEKTAWHVANSTLSMLVAFFFFIALFVFIFAKPLYQLIAGDTLKSGLGIGGGFNPDQIIEVVRLARIILIAQFFFAVSVLTTGVIESYKRFLVPAIAPLFYNLGVIFGTIFLTGRFGLLGPTIGTVIGAAAHLLVQLPVARHLGYVPRLSLDLKHPGVQKIIQLSSPKVLELTIFQLKRMSWLFLASVVGGGFTYLKSGDLLQGLPVGIFGTAIAKAALPTLSDQVGSNKMDEFWATFKVGLGQILFFVVPTSVFLAVLRIPVVRLVFGGTQFDWTATVQTGYVVSAFALGIFAYAGTLIVNRGFYALQNTKTPVGISIFSVVLGVVLSGWFTLVLHIDTWSIALAFSIAGILQFFVLTHLLIKTVKGGYWELIRPFIKLLAASFVSGSAMFLLLKFFDRSAWVKRISFLGAIESTKYIPFETFVLDTSYTVNLIILTFGVLLIGSLFYLGMCFVLRVNEVYVLFGIVGKMIAKGKGFLRIQQEGSESVTPPPIEVDH